jgi:hypothetical protein
VAGLALPAPIQLSPLLLIDDDRSLAKKAFVWLVSIPSF